MSAKFQDRGEKDLFDQFQTADTKIRKKTRSLLPIAKKTIIVSYENVIFFVIGFIMSCVIVFSLGVEKGKRQIDPASRKDDTVKIEAGREKNADTILAKKKIEGNEYIIQIAAFKKSSSAEEESARLKKEGYDARVKKSGVYYQVYVTGFMREENAQKLLEELRKKYKDCYMREL